MVVGIGPISKKILQINMRQLVIESMAVEKKAIEDWKGGWDYKSIKEVFDTGDYYDVMFEDPFSKLIAPEIKEPPVMNKRSSPPPGKIIMKTLMKKYRDESRR